MEDFVVGMAYVSFYLRHSRSLKDRRQFVQGVTQKLKNEGFSVVNSSGESEKTGRIAFAMVGTQAGHVKQRFDKALELFLGHCEILAKRCEFTDFKMDEEIPIPDEMDYPIS